VLGPDSFSRVIFVIIVINVLIVIEASQGEGVA